MARNPAAAVNDDNIILIGMPGAGKTVVGRAAAKALNMRFADTDDLVRQRAGKSIADIFAQNGERAFRIMERKALKEALSGEGAVVAVGGGALLRYDNSATMRKRGIIVHLNPSLNLLRARLEGDQRQKRPLLQNADSLAQLYRERMSEYCRMADFTLDGSGRQTPAAAAARIIRVMRESPAIVRVPLPDGRDYPVVADNGLLSDAESWLGDSSKLAVVTSENVFTQFGARVAAEIPKPPLTAFVVIPDGEERKTLDTVGKILDRLVEIKLGRNGTVLALGGGVVGDVGGFAAAIYMRGARLLQAPTTLLAMVDAAIGGKTGVNHPKGKNLIGAFHQPAAVLCDLDALETLPDAEKRAGLAEVVKYGMLGDAAFFDWLEKNADDIARFDPSALRRIVIRSARAKAAIVGADEKESGSRALLNLGHTFAHAIESAAGYGKWRHGEAVAAGLVAAAELSARVMGFPRADVGRARDLLRRLGLPVALPAGLADDMRAAMQMDKKNIAGKERFVLMRVLGDAFARQTASEADLRAALDAASERAQ